MFSSIFRIATRSSPAASPSSGHQPIADDWEIIEEDRYSFDGSDDGDVISEQSGSKLSQPKLSPDSKPLSQVEVPPPVIEVPYLQQEEEEEEEEEDDDDDDDVYGDEVDDHLVPWEIKGRFGKQRITKMGKRGQPKFNRANKLPCYYHNRPKALPRRQPVFG